MCLMVWRVSDCHIRCPSIKVLSEISLISSVSRGGWDESTDLITKQLSLAIHSIDLFTSVLLSCNSNENDQNAWIHIDFPTDSVFYIHFLYKSNLDRVLAMWYFEGQRRCWRHHQRTLEPPENPRVRRRDRKNDSTTVEAPNTTFEFYPEKKSGILRIFAGSTHSGPGIANQISSDGETLKISTNIVHELTLTRFWCSSEPSTLLIPGTDWNQRRNVIFFGTLFICTEFDTKCVFFT